MLNLGPWVSGTACSCRVDVLAESVFAHDTHDSWVLVTAHAAILVATVLYRVDHGFELIQPDRDRRGGQAAADARHGACTQIVNTISLRGSDPVIHVAGYFGSAL